MEGLAPPLKLTLEVIRQIENGESIRSGIINYLHNNQDEFAYVVTKWIYYYDQNINETNVHLAKLLQKQSKYRVALLKILILGLKGYPIYDQIRDYEKELLEICENEMEKYISLLPFKTLIPLLLFQFPAFFMLIVIPLLKQLLKYLNL